MIYQKPWNIYGTALIDSGAGGIFINESYAKQNNIPLSPLQNPIPVFNVDGTPNKDGVITHYANLTLEKEGRQYETS
jgi:hypothetical protein